MIEITKRRTNYEVRFPYDKALQDYIKLLPKDQQCTKMDLIQLPDNSTKEDWYRIVNDAGLAKIIDYIKANNLKFKFTNLEQTEIEVIKNQYLERQKKEENIHKTKTTEYDVSKVDFSFMKIQPYDYQKQGVLFFDAANGKAILGDQPGVGKSLQAISYATKNKLKTLIISPASLKLNWKNEVIKFTNEKAYIYKHKPKRGSDEVVYSKEESLFHIINYESLETFIKFLISHKCTFTDCGWSEENTTKKYKECPKCRHNTIKSRASRLEFIKDKNDVELNPSEYDLVVCDEAHYLKNVNAGRTKITKKAFKDCPKKLLLTGTAIKNRPYEFFSLLNFLDSSEWKSAHTFGVKYCAGFQNNFGWDYSGSSNLDELYKRISPYFIRRLKKDVLPFLPEKTFTSIPIELTDIEYRKYREIEKGVINEMTENDDEATKLVKIQKLKQFTSQIKAERAIDFIRDIIDGEQKIVVFTEYVATAESVGEKFGNEAVVFTGKKNMNEKQHAVDLFMKNENTKVFVGTIGAAGEGITLTSASITLFLGKPWEPASFIQACDRIHRVGQMANKVQIISLVCQGTIDEDIEKLLEEKSKVVSKVLDGVELNDKVSRVDASIFRELAQMLLLKKNKI